MDMHITIALLGSEGAGKSTLLNALLGDQYTFGPTRVPQIYIETDQQLPPKSQHLAWIQEKSRSLSHIQYIDELTEMCYFVPKNHNQSFQIYDIPPIKTHKSYIETNFLKFDIVIHIMDINLVPHACTSTNEIAFIGTNIQSNHQHGIPTLLINLFNKADKLELYDGTLRSACYHQQKNATQIPALVPAPLWISALNSMVTQIAHQNSEMCGFNQLLNLISHHHANSLQHRISYNCNQLIRKMVISNNTDISPLLLYPTELNAIEQLITAFYTKFNFPFQNFLTQSLYDEAKILYKILNQIHIMHKTITLQQDINQLVHSMYSFLLAQIDINPTIHLFKELQLFGPKNQDRKSFVELIIQKFSTSHLPIQNIITEFNLDTSTHLTLIYNNIFHIIKTKIYKPNFQDYFAIDQLIIDPDNTYAPKISALKLCIAKNIDIDENVSSISPSIAQMINLLKQEYPNAIITRTHLFSLVRNKEIEMWC